MKQTVLCGILLWACHTATLLAQDDEFVSPRFRNNLPTPTATPPPPAVPTPTINTPTSDKPATEIGDKDNATAKSDKGDKGDKGNKGEKGEKSAPNPYDKVKVVEKAVPVYTFNSERRYTVIHELDGEQFVPAQYQSGNNDVSPLYPGDVNIRIGAQTITFEGVKNLDEFQILSKFTDRIGYIYELMDKKGQPARFKVVLDQDKYVNLLYFFSKVLGEHTFFLAQKTEQDRAAELTYFTPKNELFVRGYQNLLDVTVHPYTMQRDITTGEKPIVLKATDNIAFGFQENSVATPQGTFSIKKANTFAYMMDGFPSVSSVVEIQTQGKPGKVLIFLNYKQQIEFIEVEKSRYYLMP